MSFVGDLPIPGMLRRPGTVGTAENQGGDSPLINHAFPCRESSRPSRGGFTEPRYNVESDAPVPSWPHSSQHLIPSVSLLRVLGSLVPTPLCGTQVDEPRNTCSHTSHTRCG